MTVILTFPPYWLRNTAAYNQTESTLTIGEYPISITKETKQKPRPVQQDYSREGLTRYLEDTFAKYGIEDQIPTAKRIILCESSWNVRASSGISFGIFQYTAPTWHDFGHGDIWDPLVQIETTARIVKKEGWGRWDCYFTPPHI